MNTYENARSVFASRWVRRRALIRQLAELAAVEVPDRLMNLRFGVHHKRPILHHRLVDGFTVEQEQMRRLPSEDDDFLPSFSNSARSRAFAA